MPTDTFPGADTPFFAALETELTARIPVVQAPAVQASAVQAPAVQAPATPSFPGFRRAAVLVPLLRAPGGLELLLSVRSSSLTHHAGQIAFPGGRLEPGETNAEAALRETAEETGLDVARIKLLGVLEPLPSPARYLVTPIVGVLPWPQPLTLSLDEVAEVFTVPLRDLLRLTPRQEVRRLEGQRRVIYYYAHRGAEGERLIWGLTGNIVADLLRAVRTVTLAGFHLP